MAKYSARLAQMEAIADFINTEMTDKQLSSLSAWEAANLDGGTVKTSDWPGWEALHIPPVVITPPRASTARGKAPIPVDLRWEVWERDDFRCRQCGQRRHLRIDHIVPESRGGPMVPDNLQTLCQSCNSIKGVHIGPFQRRLT